jgi:hypothetical protein
MTCHPANATATATATATVGLKSGTRGRRPQR